MSDSGSGGRRLKLPLPPPRPRKPAQNPPTQSRLLPPRPAPPAPKAPMARLFPPPAPAQAEAQRPAQEPRPKSFKEMLGPEAYRNLGMALNILCRQCHIDLKDFKTAGEELRFRGRAIASITAGELLIPLSEFGAEWHIYSLLVLAVHSGELPAPSLRGLEGDPPPGLFIHITPQGFELKCGAETENRPSLDDSIPVSIAPAEPAPQPAPEKSVRSNLIRLFEKMGQRDPRLKRALSIDGDDVLLTLEGEMKRIASMQRGQMRIFFEDIGWCREAAEADGRQSPGMRKAPTRVANEQHIKGLCGPGGIAELNLKLLKHARQTFLRITETDVFISAASSRTASPFFEEKLQI